MDSEGNVLDVLLQRHRDTKAAKQFLGKLLEQQGFVPQVSTYSSCSAAIVKDKLKSDEAAKKQVMLSVEHQ
ncbi:DDE-type integrase/transposase/recombinase [Leptolyngbya sp. FACHB-17]|uniref:DDE-type integrase/transposase/recombinase n=1 Tax=unclassified Leptolyngbya TaxID=2650499 RepID=UPI0032202301